MKKGLSYGRGTKSRGEGGAAPAGVEREGVQGDASPCRRPKNFLETKHGTMPFEFHQIPANGGGEAAEALNRSLRGGRIAAVRKEFVANGENSFWAFCVERIESTSGIGVGFLRLEKRRFISASLQDAGLLVRHRSTGLKNPS